ncbi:MAG: FHA domain-containing protein [Lentisphaerae bacterium]|nr:FHA domain-containing protein [Lentisphaerota bacterium]
MTKLIFRAANGDAQDVVLPELGATIGRSPDNTVPIDEPSVSGHHGSIRFEHGEWWVRDNGSSNGTCVNDVEVKESVLKDGDRLRFGSIECVFASAPELPVPVADFAVPAAPVADFAVPAAPVVPEAVAAESNPVQPVVAEPAVAPVAAMAAAAPPVEAHAKPELKLPPKPALKPGWKLPGKTPVAAKAPEASASAKVPETPAPAKAAEPTVPAKAKDRAEAKSAAPEWKPPVLEVVKDAALPPMADDDVALIAELKNRYLQIKEQLANVVIGQTSVVEEVLVAVFSRGHALLVGVPGLAKTLLISTLARVLDLGFKRVQFTPDLMPSDITGTDVLEEDKVSGVRRFRFVKGPIFTNMLLADEINRTPPKTQAALLEAMQEHHITVGSETYHLDEPFFVLATQNPIEQEGTYPLPEAQMDRFMFNIVVDYPSAEEESRIISSVTGATRPSLDKLLDGPTVIKLQDVVRRVPVAPHVIDYARNLARATRPKQPEAPDFVREMVGWGAGPRAGISLIQAAKARAILHGRHHATTADVSAVALPVLRHRVITTFAAEASGVKSDDVVRMLLQAMKPREDLEI